MTTPLPPRWFQPSEYRIPTFAERYFGFARHDNASPSGRGAGAGHPQGAPLHQAAPCAAPPVHPHPSPLPSGRGEPIDASPHGRGRRGSGG